MLNFASSITEELSFLHKFQETWWAVIINTKKQNYMISFLGHFFFSQTTNGNLSVANNNHEHILKELYELWEIWHECVYTVTKKYQSMNLMFEPTKQNRLVNNSEEDVSYT
jgi:hypothetical protein